MKNSEERSLYEQAFIERIGDVIHKNRKKNNYTLDNLSTEIGVSGATISRYEKGKIDIPASMMARISYVCSFPLRDYMADEEKKYPKLPSDLFKEILSFCNDKDGVVPRPKTERYEPLYDRTDENGNLIPTYKIRKELNTDSPDLREKEDVPPPNDEMFDFYISEEEPSKQGLLLEAYRLGLKAVSEDSKELKTATKALARYIASDDDAARNKRLRAYYVQCMDWIMKTNHDKDGGTADTRQTNGQP